MTEIRCLRHSDTRNFPQNAFSLFSCKIPTYAAEIHISKQIFSKTPSSNTQTQILIQKWQKSLIYKKSLLCELLSPNRFSLSPFYFLETPFRFNETPLW